MECVNKISTTRKPDDMYFLNLNFEKSKKYIDFTMIFFKNFHFANIISYNIRSTEKVLDFNLYIFDEYTPETCWYYKKTFNFFFCNIF